MVYKIWQLFVEHPNKQTFVCGQKQKWKQISMYKHWFTNLVVYGIKPICIYFCFLWHSNSLFEKKNCLYQNFREDSIVIILPCLYRIVSHNCIFITHQPASNTTRGKHKKCYLSTDTIKSIHIEQNCLFI